ncbi:MAG: 2-dehydropantoate 2-reductase [Microthrixaceae bacterium]
MMRVAVIGVGSVGGYLASRALEHSADSGTEVVLCARRPFAELVVESRQTKTTARHRVEPLVAPDEVPGRADIVIVATKAHHDVAGWLDALTDEEGIVVVAQNGVEQVERITPHTAATVIPSVVYCGTEMLEPGRVIHHNTGFLLVPDGDAALAVAGMYPDGVIRPSGDFTTRAWQKLTLNVISNGITALTNRRMDVLAEAESVELALRLSTECTEVGRAEGAGLVDSWPKDAVALTQAAPGDQGTSMFYDRVAGRELEWDAIHGAAQRAARRHGIDVPAIDTMVALLAGIRPGS